MNIPKARGPTRRQSGASAAFFAVAMTLLSTLACSAARAQQFNDPALPVEIITEYLLPQERPGIKVLRMKMPSFPAGLLERGVAAEVTVELGVDAAGAGTVISLQSSPADPAMEEAVRNALAGWVFSSSVDAGCKPHLSRATIRFRFSVAEGKASVKHEIISPPAATSPAMQVGYEFRSQESPGATFTRILPVKVLRAAPIAVIHVRVDLDQSSGKAKVVDVVTRAGEGFYLRDVSSAAYRAAMEMEVAPKTSDGKLQELPPFACVVFRLHPWTVR